LDRPFEINPQEVHGEINGSATAPTLPGVVPLRSGGENLELPLGHSDVPPLRRAVLDGLKVGIRFGKIGKTSQDEFHVEVTPLRQFGVVYLSARILNPALHSPAPLLLAS